ALQFSRPVSPPGDPGHPGLAAGTRVRSRQSGTVHPGGTPMLTDAFRRELRWVLGADAVVDDPLQLATYECDGLTGYRVLPALVVLPESTEQVAAVVRACAREGVPFVARGAGTGLSGGALPHADGVLIVTARMRRILEGDLANRRMTLEPGVTNLDVSKAVAGDGMYYAPDPSSQVVCTIGGNVAGDSRGAPLPQN